MKLGLTPYCLALPLFCYGADADTYMKVIQLALDRQPALCLGKTQWPVSMARGESVWINAKMEALVDAGLLKAQQTANRKTWSLTRAGQAAFNLHGDFCYGRVRIKKIERIVSHGYGNKSVIFYYDIENLPHWAKDKSIRVAYTELDNMVMGIESARYQADLTTGVSGMTRVIGEPYQLDLFY